MAITATTAPKTAPSINIHIIFASFSSRVFSQRLSAHRGESLLRLPPSCAVCSSAAASACTVCTSGTRCGSSPSAAGTPSGSRSGSWFFRSSPSIVTHTLGISDAQRLQIFAFTICASSLYAMPFKASHTIFITLSKSGFFIGKSAPLVICICFRLLALFGMPRNAVIIISIGASSAKRLSCASAKKRCLTSSSYATVLSGV